MDSKSRLLKAWSFEEPDRVPIEMFINPKALELGLPGAQEVYEFQKNEADNFLGVSGFDWGFLGIDAKYHEKTIEDVPGKFKRIEKTYHTAVGDFTAITKHNYSDLYGEGDPSDYHWEKRFIHTFDDFKRITGAPRSKRSFNLKSYNRDCSSVGTRGIPITGLLHPLGTLVRNSNMEEVYMWILSEEQTVMEFLEQCTIQICDSLSLINGEKLTDPPVFKTHALEMFIPPWFGQKLFKKFIFPFDKRVNDAVHAIGGRHFAHCHGNCGKFLEHFADMGIDAIDPLEPPPYGDNNLSQVKKSVGGRMLLAGNIPSQAFVLDSFKPEDVFILVKKAIEDGALGGGFTLRTTGSAYVGNGKTAAQRTKSIACGLAMIKAWRELCKL